MIFVPDIFSRLFEIIGMMRTASKEIESERAKEHDPGRIKRSPTLLLRSTEKQSIKSTPSAIVNPSSFISTGVKTTPTPPTCIPQYPLMQTPLMQTPSMAKNLAVADDADSDGSPQPTQLTAFRPGGQPKAGPRGSWRSEISSIQCHNAFNDHPRNIYRKPEGLQDNSKMSKPHMFDSKEASSSIETILEGGNSEPSNRRIHTILEDLCDDSPDEETTEWFSPKEVKTDSRGRTSLRAVFSLASSLHNEGAPKMNTGMEYRDMGVGLFPVDEHYGIDPEKQSNSSVLELGSVENMDMD